MWLLADDKCRIGGDIARNDLSLLKPGVLGVEDHQGGKGHVYMVLGIVDPRMDLVRCISPNSSTPGSREGGGVVEQQRMLSRARGFLDFSR